MSAELPTLFACERGLGQLLDSDCAHRWREANGKVVGTSAERLMQLQRSPCAGCPYGAGRVKAGKHLLEGQPATSEQREIIPLAEVAARLRARERPEATTEPAAPPAPDSNPVHEEAPVRKAICESCEREFNVKTDRGALPRKCPQCKAENASAAPAPAPASKPRTAAPPATPSAELARTNNAPAVLLGGYRVRIGGVNVECATLQHLVELIDHYGDQGA